MPNEEQHFTSTEGINTHTIEDEEKLWMVRRLSSCNSVVFLNGHNHHRLSLGAILYMSVAKKSKHV